MNGIVRFRSFGCVHSVLSGEMSFPTLKHNHRHQEFEHIPALDCFQFQTPNEDSYPEHAVKLHDPHSVIEKARCGIVELVYSRKFFKHTHRDHIYFRDVLTKEKLVQHIYAFAVHHRMSHLCLFALVRLSVHRYFVVMFETQTDAEPAVQLLLTNNVR